MEYEGRLNEKVTGWGMKEVGADQLIWPAAWLRLRRLSRSPCRWGRCWWTPPDCRHYSGTSRPPSSLSGYWSLCIFWPPPAEELSDISNLQKFSLENPTKQILRIQIEWSSVISIQLWQQGEAGFDESAMLKNSCKPTLTICSLGSRLQSASVISSPSKKLRFETLMSSMLLWSISSGRGERR